ncbi:MAG: stage VI sporulation protein F [Bacilli bacterium]|nr:stage VI sporulation protein F [Bacilli bacterium]
MNKALNFISENNIQPEALFALVDKVQRMDLSNETNIRQIIRAVAEMANRKIDKQQEDRIVYEILKNGVNENIFDMI